MEGVAYVSIIKATTQDGGEWECWHYNKNSPLAKIKVMKLTVSSKFAQRAHADIDGFRSFFRWNAVKKLFYKAAAAQLATLSSA